MAKAKYVLLAVMGFCSVQFAVQDAGSCSVPVFRYALERWKPDPYKGIFIYRGEITKKDEALLRQLEEAAVDSDYPFNLRIRAVETEAFSEERLKELLKSPIPKKLPALAIWYPDQMGKTAPLWILEPTPAVMKALTESPKRKQLAESLINGESIVWVFVPSGDSRKDERARKLIRQELDLALSSLVKMPFYIMSGSKEKKLTYGFPILTLSRGDPDERFFLDMILNSEPDLNEHTDEPMVFPIFGRGRLLGCLFGKYISEENIQGAIAFLAGSCSCEAKALNPGMDLLISALWDRVVMGELYVDDDTPMPELTGVMPQAPDPVEKGASPPEDAKKGTGIFRIYGITLGSVVVLVVFASLILNHRRKGDQ